MAKKELHLSNSLEGLEVHYAVDSNTLKKPVPMLLKALAKIRESADKARLDGDEEISYVLYMKFLNILSKLQKREDFKKEKEQIAKIIGNNATVTKIYENLEKLKVSLVLRYQEKNANHLPVAESTRLDEPEPVQLPTPAPKKRSISCYELNSLMESNDKVLIMDCRPETDFEESKMLYHYTLNVPESLCSIGLNGSKLDAQLPNSSKVFWQLRQDRSKIILVDWKSIRYNRNSAVWHLWQYLQEWDQSVENKDLLLLEGGYETWKTMYPMKCLNPNYSQPNPVKDDAYLENIEYPTLDDIQMKSPSVPQVDRSSKYNAMKAHEKTKDELLSEKRKVLDDSLMIEKTLLDLEMEYTSITTNKENDEDSVRSEQEKLYKIYELESKAKDIEAKEDELKIQLELKADKNQSVPFTKSAQVEAEIKKTQEDLLRVREDRLKKQLEREKALELARERKPQNIGYTTPAKAKRSELILSPKALSNHNVEQKIPTFDRSSKPAFNSTTRYEYNEQDFSPVYGKTERGLTGLKNLGNTCYMNSIIQCLSNTTTLTQYLVDNNYEKHVNRSNKTKGHIVRTLAAVIKMLWNGECKYISSKQLKGVIGEQDHLFYGTEQQDSHEFLIMLIDWLQSDLQTISVHSPQETLPPSEKAWLEYTKARESFILRLFYGQIKSTVKCTVCENESSTYETFSNLSLELPPNNIDRCHITECFNMYFHGEMVKGWNCPRCKVPRDAIKKLDISKLPPVLVIHLKRFYADQFTSSFKKKTIYVDFPLSDLNMLPYVARTEKNTGSNSKHIYNLYAVSNHYGTMESGHYTAFCKNSMLGKWHKYDDHTVHAMDKSDVKSSAAYILFYTTVSDIARR